MIRRHTSINRDRRSRKVKRYGVIVHLGDVTRRILVLIECCKSGFPATGVGESRIGVVKGTGDDVVSNDGLGDGHVV